MRFKKLKIITTIFLLTFLFQQDAFEKFLENENKSFQDFDNSDFRDFDKFKKEITQDYEDYEEKEKREFEEFKNKVEQKWEEFLHPTNKVHVVYDKDLNGRKSIDFEKGEIKVEVIVDRKESIPEKEIKNKISNKVAELVTEKAEDDKPILNKQLTTKSGKEVNHKNAVNLSKNLIEENKVTKKEFKAKDGVVRIKHEIIIPLKKNHLNERAKRFESEVYKQSKKWKLDPAIVFAVMETESAFNPKAKSHIPAYGLMQLVPKSGGRDAYIHVYGKDKLLTSDYLYIPKNNIELGCAYLSKIRYQYFKGIKDDEVAMICSIPAYNTGIGNVSITLCGKPKLKPASEKANKLSPEQTYKKLVNNLKYEEARNYLKRVWERKNKYKS